jgi:CheY-like chemotaxis protein
MNERKMDYSRELVLVVDDEGTIRQTIVEMLRHLGFSADYAESGKDALDRVRQKNYHFILIDIRMPEMDGVE